MTEIPGYQIRRELGHGGMATVYLAIQESLDRSVALKVMAPSLATDRTFTQRFIKEGKTIAKFSHPHIIGVFDVGVSETNHYIAMELVSGGDLKRKLKNQGAYDPEDALETIKHVGSALGYAHKQGFVHRDVKSENILFRDDGSAVLTDFGIAKAADSGTHMTGTGMSIGTPHYMSPEQARGKQVDGRSDIYSLGVVLYEMLTGKVPYEADDSVAIGIMHVSKPVPSLSKELSEYNPLLKKMLAKDPKDRFQTAEELNAEINKQLNSKRDTGTSTATHPAVSRWVFWGSLLSVLAVGMSIGYFAIQPEGRYVENVDGGKSLVGDETSALPDAATAVLLEGKSILQIKTSPANIEVHLDGHFLGLTPFLSSELPPGTHTVLLKHRYYSNYQEEVELQDDKVLKRELTLLRGRGIATILSDPSNAEIFINGEKQSERTPATINDVFSGVHQVIVRAPRRQDANFEIEVLPGETTVQTVSLKGGDLVQAGDRWVLADDAASEFLQLARDAAGRGQLKKTKSHLKQAEKYAGSAQAGMQEADAILEMAIAAEAKFTAANSVAVAAMRKADAALANYEKATAIRYYREVLAVLPDDEDAKAGLALAEGLKIPGQSFSDTLKDGSAGPELLVIPQGKFLMGSKKTETGRVKDEGPQHQVSIANPFALGKYEITFEEYDRYARAAGRSFASDRGWGRGHMPVINISWQEAKGYTEWLSRLTGKNYRLPSEAEWEYANRAGTTTAYWWGNRQEKKRGNCDGCMDNWAEKRTMEVGSFKANAFGLHDTAGNVFEWTQDCLNSNYQGAPSNGSAWLKGNCAKRMFRGGSWYFGPLSLRSAARDSNVTGYRSSNVGFRVLRELP